MRVSHLGIYILEKLGQIWLREKGDEWVILLHEFRSLSDQEEEGRRRKKKEEKKRDLR